MPSSDFHPGYDPELAVCCRHRCRRPGQPVRRRYRGRLCRQGELESDAAYLSLSFHGRHHGQHRRTPLGVVDEYRQRDLGPRIASVHPSCRFSAGNRQQHRLHLNVFARCGAKLQHPGTVRSANPRPLNEAFTIADDSLNSNPSTQTITLVGIGASSAPTISLSPSGGTLPVGTNGIAYSQSFVASGGTVAVPLSITAGTLPTGLTLSSGGVLSGAGQRRWPIQLHHHSN